jgi:hypothetical protein
MQAIEPVQAILGHLENLNPHGIGDMGGCGCVEAGEIHQRVRPKHASDPVLPWLFQVAALNRNDQFSAATPPARGESHSSKEAFAGSGPNEIRERNWSNVEVKGDVA